MAAPRPKSPLDPCGRHRLQLAVDALHRQISFLENPVGVFELLPVDLRRRVLRRPAQGAELLLRMPPVLRGERGLRRRALLEKEDPKLVSAQKINSATHNACHHVERCKEMVALASED
uniref:Uncharacterized protein n=1 Tax=Aegilops tauschii TaxID=37682 RepID=M8ARU7_AEGTA